MVLELSSIPRYDVVGRTHTDRPTEDADQRMQNGIDKTFDGLKYGMQAKYTDDLVYRARIGSSQPADDLDYRTQIGSSRLADNLNNRTQTDFREPTDDLVCRSWSGSGKPEAKLDHRTKIGLNKPFDDISKPLDSISNTSDGLDYRTHMPSSKPSDVLDYRSQFGSVKPSDNIVDRMQMASNKPSDDIVYGTLIGSSKRGLAHTAYSNFERNGSTTNRLERENYRHHLEGKLQDTVELSRSSIQSHQPRHPDFLPSEKSGDRSKAKIVTR